MTTIAQSNAQGKQLPWTLLFPAIEAATRLAVAKYGPTASEGEQARMLKGALIALDGKVIALDNGTAEVRSQFGTQTYIVNGACCCPDKRRERTGYCKHEWGKALYKKALSILLAAQDAARLLEDDGPACPACGWHLVEEGRCRLHIEVGRYVHSCGWQAVAL